MPDLRAAPAIASLLWRRLDTPGHDAASLARTTEGFRLEGVAAFVESGAPCQLHYRVEVDHGWHTREAAVHGWLGAAPVDVHIRAVAGGRWLLDGDPQHAVDGCIDVDLAFTPATNLLPIRRLALPVGASATVVAAWLPFPERELRRLSQVYRRTAEDSFHYESSGGSFQATLAVSPHGFVTRYSGLWDEERG